MISVHDTRTKGRMYLNDRGQVFLKGVEASLYQLDQARASIQDSAESSRGNVTIGVFGPQSEPLDFVLRFMHQYPHISVNFDARQSSLDINVTRAFDLVFYAEGPSFESVHGVAYAYRHFFVCVSPDHRLANLSEARLEQFKDEPFILTNTTAGQYEQAYARTSVH